MTTLPWASLQAQPRFPRHVEIVPPGITKSPRTLKTRRTVTSRSLVLRRHCLKAPGLSSAAGNVGFCFRPFLELFINQNPSSLKNATKEMQSWNTVSDSISDLCSQKPKAKPLEGTLDVSGEWRTDPWCRGIPGGPPGATKALGHEELPSLLGTADGSIILRSAASWSLQLQITLRDNCNAHMLSSSCWIWGRGRTGTHSASM